MPMPVPLSKICELPSVPAVSVHLVTKLVVPVPATFAVGVVELALRVVLPLEVEELVVAVALPLDGPLEST